MVCKSCSEDKVLERFEFEEGTDKREQTCKACRRFIGRITKLKQEVKQVKEQSNTFRDLWIECIESCEVRNSRRLRLTVDKAKQEIGGYWSRKAVL